MRLVIDEMMGMKTNLLHWASLALLAIVTSCSPTSKAEPELPQQADGPGRIELSATLEESFDLDLGDEDNLRALDVYQRDANRDGRVDAKEAFTFDIDIERYKGKKMHLFLKRRGSSTVTTLFAPVVITKTSQGRYQMKAVLEHVQAQGGLDFSQGEWYISGFWGGGTQQESPASEQERLRHTVAEVRPVSPLNLGDKVEMDIPLGFPWTRITGKQMGPVYLMQNFDLRIRPMGVLLSLRLENRTRYMADIESLDKEMFGFAFGGYFDVSNVSDTDLTGGRFPAFKPSLNENVNNETVNILPRQLSLASTQKATMPIYMWLMPTEEVASGDHALTFTFVSKKRTTMDTDLYETDRFQTNGLGEFYDRYVIDLSFRKTPTNSQYFIKDVKIKSGLMITEYFINRYRFDTSNNTYANIREPNFYGYVELYNPNLDPIQLEHYALARISNLRPTFFIDGKYSAGPNYCFFHPFAMERYNEWAKVKLEGQPTGTADRRADQYTKSNQALLISLQLKNGAKSSFQPNSLGFLSKLETKQGIQERLENIPSNDDRIEQVRFLKGEPAAGQKAQLEGGKTMLLLGNGFIERGDPANIPDYSYYYQKTNETLILKPQHRFKQEDWDKVVANPECQIIVALDNYQDRTAYPIDAKAGVLNLNWSDALILIQKHPGNFKRRRMVDATSVNPFARVDNWTEFVKKVTLTDDENIGFAHFRVRTVAQRMPEFLNFSEKQWHSVHFWNWDFPSSTTASIDAKVSPGKRSTRP